MHTTMTITIIKHAARRPALRWYSDAVDSSSAAPDASTATEEMFDSILSNCVDGFSELFLPETRVDSKKQT